MIPGIFVKYLKNRRYLTTDRLSLTQAFRRSKFYVSIILVGSSLFLSVTPLLLYTISRTLGVHLPTVANLYIDCSLLLSDTVDAVVYVFFYQPIRRLVVKTYSKAMYSTVRKQRTTDCVIGGHVALISILSTQGHKYIRECQVSNAKRCSVVPTGLRKISSKNCWL